MTIHHCIIHIRIEYPALGQGGRETTLLDLGTSKIRLAGKNSKTIPVYECEVAKEIYVLKIRLSTS